MNQEKRYFIAKPTKTRKTYVLVCYTLLDRKKKQYHPISESLKSQVAGINEKFLSGLLQPHEVEALLKDIIDGLYRSAKVL